MKDFHLGDILTVTTGRLVSPTHMAGLHQLLDYMTGDQIYTHQLPRAAEECNPALLAQHPALAAVDVPDKFDGKEHVERWLAEQVRRFGEFLPVAPLAPDDHTRIDPIAELRMAYPGVPVIPIVVDP